MSLHAHPEYVPGCYRCQLSLDEATDAIRHAYVDHHAHPDGHAEFNDWLALVKAEAWDEGHRYTGYEPAHGENPYRRTES